MFTLFNFVLTCYYPDHDHLVFEPSWQLKKVVIANVYADLKLILKQISLSFKRTAS